VPGPVPRVEGGAGTVGMARGLQPTPPSVDVPDMTGRLVALRHAGTGELGSGLAALAHAGVVTVHDPLRPGTTADIDHVVVAPTGLWVIHTRRGEGRVARKDGGGLLGTDARLYVGGRDRATLVPAIWKQVAAVRSVLGREWAAVPVRPVLCFVGSDWDGSPGRSSSTACLSPGPPRRSRGWLDHGPAPRRTWTASPPPSRSVSGRRRSPDQAGFFTVMVVPSESPSGSALAPAS
jgi:hypothetical protein